MIDRFLRRLPLGWRLLSAYLLVVLAAGAAALGAYLGYGSLIEAIRGLPDVSLEHQLVDLINGRLQVILLGSLVLLGLGLVLVLYISRSVIHQLNELRDGVDAFRAGKKVPDRAEGPLDELGLLALSISHLGTQMVKNQAEQDRGNAEKTQSLRKYVAQMRTASELAREMTIIKDLDSLASRCVSLIQARFNLYFVGIYLVDDERRFMVLKAAAGSSGSFNLQRGEKIRLAEVNVQSNVAGSGDPRIINNVENDYIFRRSPLLPDTRAQAVIPLKVGQDVIGVLDLHSEVLNSFGEDEVIILQILADELSVAVQNAYLEQSLQQKVVEANSLNQRYTQTVWSRESLGKRIGGYEYNLLEVKPIENNEGKPYELPEVVLNRLKQGKPAQVKAAMLANFSETQEDNADPDRSILLVPLLMVNQIIGIIGLEDDQIDHEWSEDEIAVVEAVANQISLSLDNVRLLEESQVRSGQLRLLQEVTAVAASHTNLYELLDNVSQKLRASFNLLHCGMFLLDPDGQSLSLAANASAEPFMLGAKMVGSRFPLKGNSLIERVILERKSMAVYDLQKSKLEGADSGLSAMQDFIQVRGAESIVFVPLFSRGEVYGVASLELQDVSAHFSETDLQLMDQISLQISSAIDVARSFEQATLRAERERRVGEITTRIRETLDIQTILKTAAHEVRQALGVPEVTVRLASMEEHPNGQKSPPNEKIGDKASR